MTLHIFSISAVLKQTDYMLGCGMGGLNPEAANEKYRLQAARESHFAAHW